MRKVAIAFGVVAALYLLIVLGFFLYQRSLIYPGGAPAAVPAGFTEIEYTATDGLKLRAAWKEPSPGRPVVLMFHGNGDNWAGASVVTAPLAELGYGILIPEYRGYAGNPGSPTEEGLYADGNGARQWLDGAGHAAESTIIIGQSIGSGVAVETARERRPLALVLISPFARLPDVAQQMFPWLPARHLTRDVYDNAAKIGAIEAPLLIIHGDRDRLIPIAHAERLAEAAGIQVSVLPGRGHEAGYTPDATNLLADWVEQVAPDR